MKVLNITKACRCAYKYLTDSDYRFIIRSNAGKNNDMPDDEYVKRMYKALRGVELDLENPKTFNEKLAWQKIYERKPLYTQLADKYAVRQYITDKIGSEYLIPLLGGPWDNADQIDFDSLPEKFILKCNHDSGGIVVCRDKTRLNIEAVKQKLNKRLSVNYYYAGREWPYKNIKPCIIAEKYMEDERQKDGLIDWKFFCFNGKAKFIYVSQGLENHATAHISFYDLDGNEMPFGRSDFAPFDKIPYKPDNLGKMTELADALATDIGCPFIRVDMYEIDGKIYFSEFTFTPCSGVLPFDPPEWDEKIGSMLKLPIDK